MSPLRRVFGERAGPAALGILVPPGPRAVLILRPRALPWDLVLTHPPAERQPLPAFWEMPRAEAEAVAEQLGRALEEGGGAGEVFSLLLPEGAGHCLCAAVGRFRFLVCPRRPREPYRPARFTDPEESRAVRAALAAVLCPPAGCVQEVYFNTRFFGR
jgi:hypothetical protein